MLVVAIVLAELLAALAKIPLLVSKLELEPRFKVDLCDSCFLLLFEFLDCPVAF
jgi:hypothetical protein